MLARVLLVVLCGVSVVCLPGDLAAAASGAIAGRVDIREPALPVARRPSIAALGLPAPRGEAARRPAVVFLETAPRGAFERQEARGRMDQRDETFLPHVLAVTVGTTVDFPNNDRTYHNVFSLSPTKRFDLGRYAAGRSKAVRFDRPGVVRVFCEIHSHMNAFILVFGHRYFAVTDEAGGYRIEDVPPGTYTVVAWYEGLERESRPVTVPPAGGVVDADFVIR